MISSDLFIRVKRVLGSLAFQITGTQKLDSGFKLSIVLVVQVRVWPNECNCFAIKDPVYPQPIMRTFKGGPMLFLTIREHESWFLVPGWKACQKLRYLLTKQRSLLESPGVVFPDACQKAYGGS